MEFLYEDKNLQEYHKYETTLLKPTKFYKIKRASAAVSKAHLKLISNIKNLFIKN